MNKEEVNQFVKKELLAILQGKEYEKTMFLAEFSYSMNGSFKGGGGAIKLGIEIGVDISNELMDIVVDYFKSVKDNILERFNKFLFEVYADGTYTASYLWDEELIKTQQLKTSRVIPQMVNDQMISWLWEIGYKNKWKEAIFSFSIKNQEVVFEGFFVDKNVQKIIPETPPQQIKDIIFTDYQMTNHGLLKDVWAKPWNKLVIRCPHNDLNLDKDVDYILVENA